ncbi:MAG: flagellar hook-length control protein FliK [Synergistaceae bacterium]|nr:flagellar hook-length control protein FliK [Synergistaceae bacterium]
MADLLTFIDIQTQAPQQVNSNSNNNNSSGEPGVFDALMNEYTTPENLEAENIQTELNEVNLIAFKGSKLFSSSVIEILADSNAPENLETLNISDEIQNLVDELKISLGKVKDSQPEVFYEDEEIKFNDEISQLLNLSDEELNAKLNSLPEDLRVEIKNLIDEINNALENGGDMTAIKSSVEKLTSLIGKTENKIKPENKKILDEESDDKKEIKDDEGQEPELISAEAAGVAAVNVNVDNKITETNAKAESEKNLDVKDSTPRQNSKIPVQNQNAENEIKADEQEKPIQKFDELIKNRAEKNSQNELESENENKNKNFDFNQDENQAGNHENFSGSRNGSRSRNENRRVSNDNSRDNERNSDSTTHRTESRNDFQSFFEGVLNSRRASGNSEISSQPLNLRGAFNLNQSETLRNGLVNVVRFIRADGVQKANVVIDPPALGRISVELTSSSSGVEASIKVASEQIRQLVQDQLTQLRMNLSEQGVQVAEFTVDVQQDNQQGSGSQNENQQDRRENFIGGIEEDDDTEEFRVDLEEGLLYWVA